MATVSTWQDETVSSQGAYVLLTRNLVSSCIILVPLESTFRLMCQLFWVEICASLHIFSSSSSSSFFCIHKQCCYSFSVIESICFNGNLFATSELLVTMRRVFDSRVFEAGRHGFWIPTLCSQSIKGGRQDKRGNLIKHRNTGTITLTRKGTRFVFNRCRFLVPCRSHKPNPRVMLVCSLLIR